MISYPWGVGGGESSPSSSGLRPPLSAGISVALTCRGRRVHRRALRRNIFSAWLGVGSRRRRRAGPWPLAGAAINGYLAAAIECYRSGEEARWPRCISLLCRTSRCNYLFCEEESIWNAGERCISIPPANLLSSRLLFFFHLKAPRIHLSMLSRHLKISKPI